VHAAQRGDRATESATDTSGRTPGLGGTAHLMMYWKSDSSPPAPTTHTSLTLYSRSKDLYRLVLPYAPAFA
jgi:hypothetical protein